MKFREASFGEEGLVLLAAAIGAGAIAAKAIRVSAITKFTSFVGRDCVVNCFLHQTSFTS